MESSLKDPISTRNILRTSSNSQRLGRFQYIFDRFKGGIDHGLEEVIKNFHDGERNVWNDFSFDPRYRHTFWSIVLGGVFGTWGNNWCSTQSMVQRMLACRTKNDMRPVFALLIAYFWVQSGRKKSKTFQDSRYILHGSLFA